MTLAQHPHSPPLVIDLRRRAEAQPYSLAVIDETTRVTYADFVAHVDHRAGVLRSAGLRPGDRVAIVADNSANFLLSAFAVWEAGGVLATIYPSTAAADLEYTLKDADPVAVLVDERTSSAVREAARRDIPIARIDTDEFTCGAVAQPDLPSPDDLPSPLFMICYSSGTTSRPKAIMLSHDAMHHGAKAYARTWRFTPDDRVIVCLPMAWLYGLCTTSMSTLLAGGTVLSLRRASPAAVAEAIDRHGATVLAGVTTIFTKLVEHLSSGAESVDTSTLRFAVSGGEPRNEAAFDRFRELVGIPVHDNYCSSECFPLITSDPEAGTPPQGSAGRLVDGSELRIVDASGSEVPPGQIGEGHSRGPGLMLGYWRNPAESAAAVTDDGWYRTQDLVRMDESGYVYVVGRLSDMIIRGGSNVSPAEVERALRAEPSIIEASVIGVPDPIYGEEVVAVVVMHEDAELDVEAIQDAVRRELASFKVPTRIIQIDALPRSTTTGKIDRKQILASLTDVRHP